MSVAPTILIRFQNISQAATNAKNTTAQMNETTPCEMEGRRKCGTA